MKRACTIVLLLAAAGCKSDGKVYRDYRSNRDSSLAFLKETFRESEELRKGSWRETWKVREHQSEAKLEARKGVAYFWESIHADTRVNAREATKRIDEEFRFDRDEFWRNARFGFLASGD